MDYIEVCLPEIPGIANPIKKCFFMPAWNEIYLTIPDPPHKWPEGFPFPLPPPLLLESIDMQQFGHIRTLASMDRLTDLLPKENQQEFRSLIDAQLQMVSKSLGPDASIVRRKEEDAKSAGLT